MTSFASPAPLVPARGKRLNAGLAFLMLAVVSPFLTPLVLLAGLPRETAAAISGLLLFGIPMALLVGAIAIMGQPGLRAPEPIDLPLSPDARHFYQSGAPLLQRSLPFWCSWPGCCC